MPDDRSGRRYRSHIRHARTSNHLIPPDNGATGAAATLQKPTTGPITVLVCPRKRVRYGDDQYWQVKVRSGGRIRSKDGSPLNAGDCEAETGGLLPTQAHLTDLAGQDKRPMVGFFRLQWYEIGDFMRERSTRRSRTFTSQTQAQERRDQPNIRPHTQSGSGGRTTGRPTQGMEEAHSAEASIARGADGCVGERKPGFISGLGKIHMSLSEVPPPLLCHVNGL